MLSVKLSTAIIALRKKIIAFIKSVRSNVFILAIFHKFVSFITMKYHPL